MNILTKVLAYGAVLLVTYSPLSNASVIVLPGIPEAGSPNFSNNAQVNLFDLGGTYLLAATNAGATVSFNHESGSVSSSATHPADFLLTAQFNGNGSYRAGTGTLRISGEIPYPYANLPGVYISGNLLTATLDSFAFDANTLGFSTTLVSGFGTLFGTAESVYLSATGLSNTLGFTSGSLVAANALQASAITTVPVPGAVWLFGSAMAGFLVSRRKTMAA